VDQDQTWTYEQYYKQVNTAAKALIELGLEPNRSVAILGTNSPEWFSCGVGAILAGGVSTGVYTTNTPAATYYQLRHSRTNVAVVEDEIQLAKVLQHRRQLPDLKAIVQYKGKPKESWVHSWESFMALGESQSDVLLQERLSNQSINQPAILCYTSGTTANPKGALLSQDNITWTCASAKETYGIQEEVEEHFISYLPVSHIVANIVDIWLLALVGGTVHFADKDALRGTLLNHLTEVRPTRFLAVPRVYEKMHSKLEDTISSSTGARAKLISWARSVSTQHHDDMLSGGKGNPLEYALAKKLVLNKIHEKLGLERCTGVYCGAAPLNSDTINYLKSVGILVTEMYGMTENPNHTANRYNPTVGDCSGVRIGSVGCTSLGTNTRLDMMDMEGVGQVSAKGRNVFMGYLSDPVKTRETFDSEGWLLTGDLGSMDNDGFLTIKGRIKDIIITSGGKNIAPTPIEDRIKSELSDFVSQCLVIGDRRKHLACLLTVKSVVNMKTLESTDEVDPDCLAWCKALGCSPTSVTDLVYNKTKYTKVYEAIMKKIELINAESPSKAAKVQKFVLLPQDFSIAGGELGPTLKVKRHAVEKKYAKDIHNMYLMSDSRTSLWDA